MVALHIKPNTPKPITQKDDSWNMHSSHQISLTTFSNNWELEQKFSGFDSLEGPRNILITDATIHLLTLFTRTSHFDDDPFDILLVFCVTGHIFSPHS